MLRKLPKHLRDNPKRLRVLRRLANGLRGLYGEPVYLCGSALLDANSDPRDWDIRIVLSDRDFALRYGNLIGGERLTDAKVARIVGDWQTEGGSGQYTRLRWRWSDDCVKHSRAGIGDSGLLIDFQVYPKTHADALYKAKPRLRLDTRTC